MAAVLSDEPKGQKYEEEHVHSVYEAIAPHFSSTRYKPWPVIERFLKSQPPGSIGLDAGCGNGKYLPVSDQVCILASDRSPSLVGIAQRHGSSALHDTLVADALALPHPSRRFDFAISIAVVHHLSTRDRRVQAIGHLLKTLRPGSGRLLVFVWALEQSSSRRGWSAEDEQDVMVPWVLQNNVGQGKKKKADKIHGPDGSSAKAAGEEPQTFHRFYHLYKQGELGEDVTKAGGTVLDAGYEKDNWWAIAAS